MRERTKQIEEQSKKYCDDGYKKYFKDGAKEAVTDETGSEIARRNFYTYEKQLTQQEEKLRKKSLRKIFRITKNGENTYLSIDFEKGNCFEVCNSAGKHIGEFRFDGVENGKEGTTRDTTGEHDIWALR